MALNRQQRRAALRSHVDAVMKRGMDFRVRPEDQQWSVIAATRIVLDILETRAPDRASRAAEWAHGFFETSLVRNPSQHKIDCKKGCAFCCKVTVRATAPELFLLAHHIRTDRNRDFDAVLARVRAADDETRPLDPVQRAQSRSPCALLVDESCSVYEARPGACRAMASISAAVCERAFHGEKIAVQTPSVWNMVRNAHMQALWAALEAAGLPATRYELHHGLRVALETPDAEARWLAGEDVFAGVARDPPLPPQVEANNRRLIAMLIAGATGKDAAQPAR